MSPFLVLAICAGLVVYLTPAAFAWSRSHHNAAAITGLNIVAGWTVIGWIVALVWSLTSPPRKA